MTTLLIDGSSRPNSNSAAFGERLLVGLPHHTVHLADVHLNFEHDYRETTHPQGDSTDDYDRLITQFQAADTVVLSTPVYWYNMSGQLKVFLDRWFDSHTHGVSFAGKAIFLLIVGADDPVHKAQPIIEQSLKLSCDWLKMTFMGTATVVADLPGDVQKLSTLPADAQKLRQILTLTTD
ncbi:flavodoxin family protein [Levilactobacillus acidifarinae]|uniref:Multimeric flavodoxin WrbA n=1 Tax=Levilactobacillus acidifarinae DSM 19394 = JCM 15949 TaxID=1423715 RepID=A0A0R1LQI8_9LACO|nr:NAD(P)H-dependent oxidoreductase [Levilactobacillus acidifarinae]KRK95891.1 multimeric flavodoxin WrbA [Levilactobacillus acidifarinae DSM 19394]GEO69192.1 NAD(P)H-dependent oxidoreductase [Levilactobacillus acidifarinae]